MTGANKYGITVLYDPSSNSREGKIHKQRDVVFDLVAIHGLNGDPFDTWTHQDTGVMWLRDLLPEALPNIRITTFGFNARFKNFTAQQDLRSISLKLLTELADIRSAADEKIRPIVLVCHSLGGIVAKKALLIGCSDEQEKVQQAVYGILFLGTPHNGSNLAVMGKLMANIVSACSPLRPPRALIRDLQKDSEVLLEITEDFVKRRRTVHLVSFYELELTSIGPFIKKMIVEQQSAVLNVPHEITVPQFADHRNIVRFKSLQDRSFRPVVSRLKEFAGTLHDVFTLEKTSHMQRDPAIPFDISAVPCSTLFGRADILETMRMYFDRNKGQTRSIFALCGLEGGSGKTQTALHYLLKNTSKYKRGVAFLNASSTASLEADFDRLHDLLHLGDSKSKTTSIKSWLARPENTEWLLVFDNADDLESVPIQKYLPAVNWGHVIITSRDQGLIGTVANEGHILRPLANEDAVQLLLEKAGIQQPSQSEIEDAKTIAELLGSLPLALVQAGAFVRSRHRSLADYRRLYSTRRQDLLRFVSRLGDTEKAVLTAWEINFKQLEQESPDAICVLFLFSFLEPATIPEVILHRGTSSQKRWNEYGEVTEIRAEDEGVDARLSRVIQSDFDFDVAVEKLLSFSLISCNVGPNGFRNFSIHPLVQYCVMQRMSQTELNSWRKQALLLICHAFPRNRYIEPLNGEMGRVILPHLSRVLAEYDAICIEDGEQGWFQRELASTLIAASRFSNANWKVEAISRAKNLLEDGNDLYLHAWLAYRESSILRMSGKHEESETALQQFLRRVSFEEDEKLTPRLNSHRGDLIISYSENLIRQGKLPEAKAELTEWTPLHADYSTLERITLRARDITLGKVLRFQGLFREALDLLEGVLQGSLLDDFFEGSGWYRALVSGVAELHCELNQPSDAESLLLRELEPMREKRTQDISTGQRLQLSLAEVYLLQHRYAEAESILFALQRAFSISGAPDYTAQVNSFRVWVSLARISHLQSHWEEALPRWKSALVVLEQIGLGGGFNAGIVRCSIAHILLMTGREVEGTETLQAAKVNLASEPRVFWIAVFNSQWCDFILGRVRL
ncbi:LipA and NB-ARC domain protein [Aspergillus ibericus CBS 121593]|uniref:GPI inositol-deacylase n=1 Tax=Aspergillus ibericus CBS 121593 TaxID=1448316 RepID=A0A395GVI2_9EURO|nr:hypothetical protein BO80DRAFT_359520 [Aspergillus ibericus CBS 121593]RAK99392.1 hypothetical protein BO80DRAFT_359520 [Aspergillus ibericus CBS 121593]